MFHRPRLKIFLIFSCLLSSTLALENQPPACYNLNMSFFVSLGIVILAMLIMACLQLQPGIFSLFYHYASGKYSKSRASDMTLFFILGAETAAACLFFCSYLFANLFFFYRFRPETSFFAWVMAGILLALAFMGFFCYYRAGQGTKLFIPRRCAQNLDHAARSVKTRSDAFTLGALSSVCELPFTLPLYIITSVEIMEMSVEFFPSHLLTILYIVIPTIPLFITRWKFQLGYNLADIQKSRVKDKAFTRIILCFSYVAISILFIYFRILT